MLTPRRKHDRRLRRTLISFLETVQLHLQGGWDLRYGWAAASHLLDEGPKSPLFYSESNVSAHLKRLAQTFPIPRWRCWFRHLSEMLSSGAAVAPSVAAWIRLLRREEELDWEAHRRTLGMRVNGLLLVFCLPPALCLLFGPLLVGMLGLQ